MPTYIALLRAVNLLGHNRIAMAHLRESFESMGFSDVRTYIQSGNVIFNSTKRSVPVVTKSIESAIEQEFGKPIRVTVRTAGEMAAIAQNNPLMSEYGADTKRLHVAFLTEQPSANLVKKIDPGQYLPDRFAVVNREIYLYLANGVAGSKLTTTLFDKKLQVLSTVRNWRTVTTLAEMSTSSAR
ncbi:DUF1697 domain-containing protein [bacterium]|nr:DUF1697 domain-containing protein [bacterium]